MLKRLIFVLLVSVVSASAFAQNPGRQPGCQREQVEVDNMLFEIFKNDPARPLGDLIIDPSSIGDPRFSGGDWAKYEWRVYRRERSTGSNTVTEFKIAIHYMWNSRTRSTAQVKIMNTMENGCTGVSRSADASPPTGFNPTSSGQLAFGNIIVYGYWYTIDYISNDRYIGSDDWAFQMTGISVDGVRMALQLAKGKLQ